MRVGSGWALRVPGQRRHGAWQRWTARLCLLGACAATEAQAGGGAAWRQAVAARAAFQAEPAGTHTRAEYTGVMDRFRAIYHGDPASVYAPRAVDAVAALLAEEGRELNDRKALRDAAGQYEFLAKSYPESTLAAPGLGAALALLGPEAAGDPAETRRVRALLAARYPRSAVARSAAAKGAGDVGVVGRASDTAEEDDSRFPVQRTTTRTAEPASDVGQAGVRSGSDERRSPPGMTTKKTELAKAETAETQTAKTGATKTGLTATSLAEVVDEQRRVPGAAPAMVTGIRHWSTATYTRVAIDLGGEVEFQAARVEHPDRIFFDLHGAKLAPGLAGKSFAITDDGFLKTIRAGQAGADVTRIVLEVQPVAEYSAFLLPNPTRLIIDVHGRAGGEPAGARVGESTSQTVPAAGASVSSVTTQDAGAAPVVRVDPHALKSTGSQVSSLPPMAVTDGSASFGLPPKRTQAALTASRDVVRQRVVVSAQPTAARPVPNSVSSAAPRANREVAAVSEGPGVIAATPLPTSQPVVDRAGSRKQEVGSRKQMALTGDRKEQPATAVAGVPAASAPPTADGQSTLMRALGLKIGRIVIDPGHGGHDSGTLGADGIEEKDVVLDVALRLGKLLHDRLGAEIVYTRADDTFIPLETRTAIANKAQADLFISVHANSSPDPSARGVEVYYLNFTSDPEAMAVAGRENAVSSGRVNQLSDLVKKIALKDKIDESRELASDVDQSLYGGLRKGNGGLKDRGVKKAPFVVLIGANMPSILAEISFVTNPDDAHQLSRPEYRERVAESLYGGVARYAATINGVPGEVKARATERALR